MRQMSLPEIGAEGQRRLSGAKALVIGLGGLGSVLSHCLAGMGVGSLTLVDPDRVELHNLDRQFLYTEEDIGEPKAQAAARRLTRLNHEVAIEAVSQAFTAGTPLAPGQYDVAVAATDSRESRLDINRACCGARIPLVCGGVAGLYGTLQVVFSGRTPCVHCAGGSETWTDHTPALAPVVSTLSALMAQAAVGVLCGWELPQNKLLLFDAKRFELEHIPLRRKEGCPHCGGLTEETKC